MAGIPPITDQHQFDTLNAEVIDLQEHLGTLTEGLRQEELTSKGTDRVLQRSDSKEKITNNHAPELHVTRSHFYRRLLQSRIESLEREKKALAALNNELQPPSQPGYNMAPIMRRAAQPLQAVENVYQPIPTWQMQESRGEESERSSLEVAYYLRLLHQSWWLILLTAVTALVIALLVSLSQVATYETHARYLISPTGDLSGTQAIYALETLKNRTIVSTYAEILNSQRIYKEVGNTLGIEPEAMADYTLTALVLPEASVLEVAVKGPDANIATLMANNVGEQAVNYLTGAYEAYEVELLDQALLPTIPVSPNPVQNASLALILGLALGSGLVLVRGYLSTLNMSESSSVSTTSPGIYSPSEFKRYLDKILPQGQPLSLGLVQLHTTNGMVAQPELLKELVEQIGKLLPGELRGKDIVGDWSDNSLAILMPSVPTIMAYSEFHYIQQILAESLKQSDITMPLVPYIGVVTSQQGESSKALIRRAEKALSEAQQSGQPVVLYSHHQLNA
jgi:capsular polysaccharide biosynthesis protein